jgi:4-amino-4-deoxy-L-arabinose transferase-like glycosyltransferase
MAPSARGVPPAVLLVALVSFALGLWLAGAFPLVDPDEGRNAEVAREMAAGGDMVIPHLAGMPYLDKPPALFWAAAAVIRVLGPTPPAARLPALGAGLATLLLLGAFARRATGDAVAWRAAALLAAAPLFAVIAAYVIFDAPLTLCVAVVWMGLADELRDGATPRRRALMFLALGLGLLVKGPVMLMWALGGSAATALLLRSRRPLAWLAWWPGWVMAIGLAGAWFAAACARHPEYPHYAFIEESFERMTSGSFKRQQPWWFVPAVLAGGALPWSLATPWGSRRLRAAPEGSRMGVAVAAGFVLFAAVFFTLSRSKLVTYLLPALPPMAWLAALAWSPPGRGWRLAFPALLLVTPGLLLLGQGRLHEEAERASGAPLARAIRGSGARTVRYEGCYSPGTDYLLGRCGTLVSGDARETTSNYQVRYAPALRRRGLWTALDADASPVDVVVRPVAGATGPPAGMTEFHRDARFVAYRAVP